MDRFESSLFDYIKNIKWGEDVLIEYTSKEPVHLLFHILLRYLEKGGYSFVIVDALDQLHVFKTHLELVGIDTSMIDNANVIKFGGVLKTGNVIGRIDLEGDISVWKKHYDDLLEEMKSERAFRVVLGLEKVLAMYEDMPRELERFFGLAIRSYLGDKRRITAYFVNIDLIKEKTAKELWEDMSRVFGVEMVEGEVTLRILKSIEFPEYGQEVRINAWELQKHLTG